MLTFFEMGKARVTISSTLNTECLDFFHLVEFAISLLALLARVIIIKALHLKYYLNINRFPGGGVWIWENRGL